ncbi:MAG: hypothetical protein BGN92_01565 [Sphingobacteriales bacterium 41-5]|nr:MAG: hypothetical protein BGN92_01565 [Sphingobacteriales bacterium 41-5]
MKKILYHTLLISLFFTTFNCNKNYLKEQPKAIINADNLYVDKAGFEAGLWGLYNLFRLERSSTDNSTNNMTITAAIIGVDNAYCPYPSGSAPERIFSEFGTMLNPTSGYIRDLFAYLYQIVNSANTIINRADNPAIAWTEKEKNSIVAEARLFRAWAYRHLTFLWGDVPLSLEEASGNNIKTDWERTPVPEVRKQMEEDWIFAEANLPDVPNLEGKVTKVIAQHYLAELYLTIGNNAKAREKAMAVIANSNYSIITNRYGVQSSQPGSAFMDMFIDKNANRSEGNKEALWVIQNEYASLGGYNNIMRRWWVNRYNTIRAGGKTPITYSIENGGRGIGRFGATKYALALYEANDERGSAYAWRHYWIMNNPASLPTGSNQNATCTNPGYTGGKLGDTVKLSINCDEPLPNSTTVQNWPNTRKWDWSHSDDIQITSNYNDQVYLRLAETYLILAEAQYNLGDVAGAATTINVLRNRAHATPVTAADVNIDLILDERSRELFSEEHRRYTLIRLHKWFERTKKYNKYSGVRITLRDTLLPIPQSVIDANLTKPFPQNAGY